MHKYRVRVNLGDVLDSEIVMLSLCAVNERIPIHELLLWHNGNVTKDDKVTQAFIKKWSDLPIRLTDADKSIEFAWFDLVDSNESNGHFSNRFKVIYGNENQLANGIVNFYQTLKFVMEPKKKPRYVKEKK